MPLPAVPAAVLDVYQGYQTWCRRNGHSTPDRVQKFVVDFKRAGAAYTVTPRIPDQQRGVQSRRRVLLIGEPLPEFCRERHRILFGVANFRLALQSYRRAPTGNKISIARQETQR